MAKTRMVDLGPGRVVGVELLGDPAGSPVLYFHGLPGSRLDFALLDSAFADAGVRLIALDRPGFGLSTRVPGLRLLDWPRDVAAVADRLAVERFSVLGYSSGGKYALACAYAIPDRLTAAGVLAGMAPPDMPGFRLDATDRVLHWAASRARPLALAFWGALRELALRRPRAVVQRVAPELPPADREGLALTVQEGLRPGPAGVVDDYAIETRPWGFDLAAIRARVIVWHGDADELAPISHSRYVADQVPNAELVVLAGAGHIAPGHLPEIASRLA
jgi:pimeloyl-ACP methyl ester carboxylesterase